MPTYARIEVALSNRRTTHRNRDMIDMKYESNMYYRSDDVTDLAIDFSS